ncbi:RusA family crossover junction endodeoxyribonuclease [Peptoniphilus lacrimalis]|uniref:Holliday junction resolvase n=1 Tax=Peptoniphilus lacrimalis TaxID=33031 RepID=A0A379C663_9FIRM|nr:RusA family crossover junction endodeoxyribonuclease [Peptoniphilus lacrimalis]SUB57733.1 Holliday junction resolvase [Peptoniphilus lacrimalis]
MHLILYGRPITKKNSSRIVKCGNYHKLLPSKAYEKYEKECLLQITGKYKLKLDGKYNLKCLYYMPTRHRVDLVNLLEATCDILVAGHVIADDNSKIIVSHDGSRVLYDKVNPRVEIFLEEVVSKNGQ